MLDRYCDDDRDSIKCLFLHSSSEKNEEDQRKDESLYSDKEALRSPKANDDNKKIILCGKIRVMKDLKDLEDQRKYEYYSIVLDESLYDGEKEYKL